MQKDPNWVQIAVWRNELRVQRERPNDKKKKLKKSLWASSRG